jgi:hypothetical protein
VDGSTPPLWEGYDEFARFGVIRAISTKGLIPVPTDQAGPRDVEESLKLAPVPWEVRTWEVFRNSLTEERYWGGLGLLTKAYFLTAVPAVGLLLLFHIRAA